MVLALRKLDKVLKDDRVKVKSGNDAFAGFEPVEELMGGPEECLEEIEDEADYIFLEEGDLKEVFEEEEVMAALATYRDIRDALNAQQKGRQYHHGGKGRGAPGKGRGKGGRYQRVHVEQLKLRTKCARCGAVGHWAKECRSPHPDRRAEGKRTLPR